MTDKKNLGKWLNQIGNFADTAKQAIKQGNNDVALNVMKTGFNELEYITDFFYVNMYLNKTSILYQNFEILKKRKRYISFVFINLVVISLVF